MFIVELQDGVYLAHGDGDPPRTLVKEYAKKYHTEHGANTGLEIARSWRPFKGGRVINLEESTKAL